MNQIFLEYLIRWERGEEKGCQIFICTTYQNRERYTQTGKNITKREYIYIPHCRKIDQMANIFHGRTLAKFTQIGIFGLKV
jgi:hypothetical protein